MTKRLIRRAQLHLLFFQLFVSIVVFSSFFSGRYYFAYLDIGSDSVTHSVAYAYAIARSVILNSVDGWSFEIGLGSPTALLMGDFFIRLSGFFGVENVLSTRFPLFLSKLIIGGQFFFLSVRYFVNNPIAAVFGSLAYSFCGYVSINGQWDVEANAFSIYPIVCWTLLRGLVSNRWMFFPFGISIALFSGVFFVSLIVFLSLLIFLWLIFSKDFVRSFKILFIRVIPLIVLGFGLSATYLLPVIEQLLDSSRVTGPQAKFSDLLIPSFVPNDFSLIAAQIGGLFHKDIFGIGNQYTGYWNYLEGPGFYIGIFGLLIIPQLLVSRRPLDRKLIFVFSVLFFIYLVFPFPRFAAHGFAAPYFRISTLWVSMFLILLSCRALESIELIGVSIRILCITFFVLVCIIGYLILCSERMSVYIPHATRILCLMTAAFLVLFLGGLGHIQGTFLVFVAVLIVVVESIVIAKPSFVEGRAILGKNEAVYFDGSMDALAFIKRSDPGFYRIEKTYVTNSLADSVAQGYRGVKAYSFNSKGVVDFYINTGLLPAESPVNNYTNWLPGFEDRVALYSLLGVKYLVSRQPISFQGFKHIHSLNQEHIYINQNALPLAFVHEFQILEKDYFDLGLNGNDPDHTLRDLALLKFAVVKEYLPGHGEVLTQKELHSAVQVPFSRQYLYLIDILRSSSLNVTHFSNSRILASIDVKRAGILIFSFPFDKGWTVRLNDELASTFRTNFGLLGIKIIPGTYKIELSYEVPGLKFGRVITLLSTIFLFFTIALPYIRRGVPLKIR